MDKYDRQIRLWSKSGQKALQKAHILIIGVQTSTTEMAKCLALSGLNHITFYDQRAVTQADLASNFFIQESDLENPIAPAIARSLAELNPDITIDAVSTLNVQEYDLVVVSNGDTATIESLKKLIGDLVEISTRGFYGRVRSFYRQFTSYQTHPQSLVDLRFGSSVWPELQQYLDSIDLEAIESTANKTIPYCTILGKVDKIPTSMPEKRQLKTQLLSKAGNDGDNWREASQNAYRLWAPVVPPTLPPLFDKVDDNLGTSPFWSMVAALRDFVSLYNAPPVAGVLPDMTSDTDSYTALQKIYREKARKDTAEFSKLLSQYPHEGIDDEVIRAFCKNSRHLLVIEGQPPQANTNAILQTQPGDPNDPEDAQRVHFRDVFDALEVTCKDIGRWAPDADSAARIGQATSHPNQRVQNEISRSGGGEINSVASMMGGIAAQEVTKLILKHYSPLQHTLVYDGTSSESAVF